VTAQEAFDLYHVAIFRFVYRLTRRVDIAEDITQECFLAFLRAPERYDLGRGSVKTYLFSIARNLVLKNYRDECAARQFEENQFALVTEPNLSLEVSAVVEQALASLPALQQETLVLFEYEGLTLEEIASVVCADVGTVKSRLHRARERLKRTLAPCKKVGGTYGTV
jgi:RNA polymerase sigma-70 factor (ECF subfamily)